MPGNATRDKLELSGISMMGNKTSIALYDTEKKTNRWFVVGETAGNIEVVSCDVKNDTAVIRVGGQSKVLALRKGAVAAASPVLYEVFSAAPTAPVQPVAADAGTPSGGPVPTSTAPATGGPMTEQKIQEQEARMLVSDLLEIGIQQRKAYDEKKAAQDAAAAGKAAPANPPTPTPPPK